VKQNFSMSNIAILLFFLFFSVLEAQTTANAATGSMTVTSHDAATELCIAEDFRVSGNFILNEDLTPTGYSNGPSEYCDYNTQYKPFYAVRDSNRTQAMVSYAVDGNAYRVISKVDTDNRSVWTEINKLLYFGLNIDVSLLEPGLHTLSILFQDVFGYYCYRPTSNSWGSGMYNQQGDIIDEFTITFRVLEEGDQCCGDVRTDLVEECGGEDSIALWDDESCSGECVLFDEEKNLGKSECDETQPYTKNPVNFATGNKYITQADVTVFGPGLPFEFHRYYNSQSETDTSMGYGWTSSFSQFLSVEEGVINLHEDNGRKVPFYDDGNGKFLNASGKLRSIEFVDGVYVQEEPDGRTHHFTVSGRLIHLKGRNGNTQNLVYENNRLVSVEDNFGRILSFSYLDNRLVSLLSSVGEVKYSYDINGNLISVVNPDGTVKSFVYDDPIDIYNLTGIINENGVRSLTAEYDVMDRAVVSELAGGLNRVEVGYPDSLQRTIADSQGNMTIYELESFGGVGRIISSAGPGCKVCPPVGSRYTMNDRLFVQNKTDERGIVTSYMYDALGNRTSMTEAAGLPEEKITIYTYESGTNLLKSVSQPSVAVSGENVFIAMTHDAFGNIISEIESGYSGNNPVSRVTRRTYNLNGQLTHMDGQREDVEDIYTFEYFPNEASEGDNRGQLKRIRNPMGHATSYSNYTSFGKPGVVIDGNGVVTELQYGTAGRPTGMIHVGLTTRFEYDPAGQLIAVRSPENGDVLCFYTEAGLLEKIQDSQGNSINYHYDSEGNRIREEIQDPGAQLTKYVDLVYDSKNRVSRIVQPDATSTSYLYDATGNVVSQMNGGGISTAYAYDGLNRLQAITDPGDVYTLYSHDSSGNVSSVLDGENHITSYAHDDFGHRLDISSPDAGAANYSYDLTGNMITRSNANGITATYSYDALNRLVSVRYPDSVQDVLYSYDQGENGIGKLTGMQNSSGEYTYFYDALGNMARNEATINGMAYVTRYSFDGSGRLAAMIYPGGRSVSYLRDSIGNIIEINTVFEGVEQKIMGGIHYLPYGSLHGATLGNGLEVNSQFDQSYRLSRQFVGPVFDKSYAYNVVGNVSNVTDSLLPENSQALTYDGVDRLISENGRYGMREYGYDKNGNRRQKVVADSESIAENVLDYLYDDKSNRLGQIDLQLRDYDGAGNTLIASANEYFYNETGRLESVAVPGGFAARYQYNGMGQRVQTIQDEERGVDGLFHYLYDPDGQLLAVSYYTMRVGKNRTTLTKEEDKEFVWLGNMPIAQVVTEYKKNGSVRSSEIFYLHTDHLNTPRLATNSEQEVVWRWDGDAFGVGEPDLDPDGDRREVDVPLRFPGQIASDGGLFYNYHRYYEPETGRYFTPDPIGLAGGLNLYGYVNNNPVNFIDPEGLNPGVLVGAIAGGVSGAMSGIQTGNYLSAIAGGVTGALVGGAVGAILPQASSAIGGMAGGAISGLFGGGAGGAMGAWMEGKCTDEIVHFTHVGMINGALSGTLGGGLAGAAKVLGATPAYSALAGSVGSHSTSVGIETFNR
jgi:RHS repeat-associated protein